MRKSQSEQVLNATAFLHGSQKKEIMRLLAMRGFSAQERSKGAQLLMAVLNREAQQEPSPEELTQKTLLLQLDAWENEWFPIARVILEQYYPEQDKRIFHQLTQQQGLAVISSVSKFLVRLEQLAASTEKKDKQAMSHLESRGLSTSERKKAKDLLSQLLGLESLPSEEHALQALTEAHQPTLAHLTDPPEEEPEEINDTTDAAYQEALDSLNRWYREWSTIARKVITRKDYLIALGLRQRAPKKPSTPEA